MRDLIDEVSEMIYVVDVDTYELLFINAAGKKCFGVEETDHRKCYEVIYDRTSPCELCNNSHLSETSPVTWECSNHKVGRHYLLKDSLIEWNGKKAKVETACDITEQERQKEELKAMLDGQNVILDCVQMLQGAEDILEVLDWVAEKIGSFVHARRAYIYENCPEEGAEGIHVWYSPEVSEEKRAGVEPEIDLAWRCGSLFRNRNCVVIQDLKLIERQNRPVYEAMVSEGVSCIVAAPLELEKKCIGYMEIDNPSEERIEKIAPLISTLAYFISSCMCVCKNYRRLERQSYTDSLTGVRNRNAYNQMVKQLVCEEEGQAGVVYIDVNDMKGLNDRFGHAFGDHILADLSGRIASCFKRDDIYRIDGDEFVVICLEGTKAQLADKVQLLTCGVREQNEYCVSIGYQWSEKRSDIRNLIAASDRMMYENKKGFYFDRPMPRHCCYQYDEIKELLNPDSLESRLADGSFLIYIQPKMAVRGQNLIGAEALVRYRNEDGLIILPDRFIPVLEEKRLIDMIDFHVFGSVCRQIRQWKDAGVKAVPISVNFSRYSLMEVNFLERLERIVSDCGIDKRLVEIEVTESADTDEGFDFLGILERIRSAGFVVSIDDFGIKYANLFLFATVDFDVLKIDKSLSQNLESNEKARAVLHSVSDICKRMGIQMIVEGIETEEQLRILEEMGCYGVQGYYFSKPVPVPEFQDKFMMG